MLNESQDCLVSNTSLNESHVCSLELDDKDNIADWNEISDDDDDDDDNAEEDSDNETYVPPGPGFASPDDLALDNRVFDKRKYLNQHT